MCSVTSAPDLPSSDSPTLALLHPTTEEQLAVWKVNGSSWKGRLSLGAYLRREEYLANQALTRDGGITFWILVDTSATSTQRTILASCESLRKRALVRGQDGRVDEVVAHGICSVFSSPDFRGKGYGRRMITELGKSLDTWQQECGRTADFTVLYSDIGKKFYSRHGWRPFPSSHMALDPAKQRKDGSNPFKNLQAADLLYADDLPDLCRADEAALRARIAQPKSPDGGITVALVPDVETIRWHHAREEFIAKELFNKPLPVKGAIVRGEDGSRVWCIWTRTFGGEEAENTLNILRLVIEGDEDLGRQTSQDGSSLTSLRSADQQRVLAAASVLQEARREAVAWTMKDVQIWNPTHLAMLAVRYLDSSATLIQRDEDSIASLRWHGPELAPGVEINWVGNEKYGWC